MKQGKGSKLTQLSRKEILLGCAVGMIMILSMAAVGAGMVNAEILGLPWMDELSAVILLIGGFAAGRIGSDSGNGSVGGWMACVMQCIILLLLQLTLYEFSGRGILAAVLPVAGGCGCARLLSGRKRGVYRRKKYGYR